MKLPKIPYGYLLLGPSIAFAVGFLSNAIVMATNGDERRRNARFVSRRLSDF